MMSVLFSSSDAEFVDRSLSHGDAEALEVLEGVWNCLEDMKAGGKRPASWEDCVTWARREWETLYNNEICQLLHCFPPDTVNHHHSCGESQTQGGAVVPVRFFFFLHSNQLSVTATWYELKRDVAPCDVTPARILPGPGGRATPG